jgi:hypothetical protein
MLVIADGAVGGSLGATLHFRFRCCAGTFLLPLVPAVGWTLQQRECQQQAGHCQQRKCQQRAGHCQHRKCQQRAGHCQQWAGHCQQQKCQQRECQQLAGHCQHRKCQQWKCQQQSVSSWSDIASSGPDIASSGLDIASSGPDIASSSSASSGSASGQPEMIKYRLLFGNPLIFISFCCLYIVKSLILKSSVFADQ